MISRFFTTTFTITRMVWSGDSSTRSSQGTFLGHVQHAGDEEMQNELDIAFAKKYRIWCPVDTDVFRDDKLTADGFQYIVKFIKENKIGNQQHLELICERDIAEPASY